MRRKLSPAAWIIVPLALLCLVAWLGNTRDRRYERQLIGDRATSQQRIDVLEAVVLELKSALKSEQTATAVRGDNPVTPPAEQIASDVTGISGTPGAAGPQGERGPPGRVGPAGPGGKDGAAGKDGTAGPVGPAGADGPNGPGGPSGPTGAQGAVGPQGPGATDQQIADAVAAYCAARNGCQGPQSLPGPPPGPL